MRKIHPIEWFAFLLVIIGGLNWLLVGVFSFNLVSFFFGDMSVLSRIVYFLVGASSIFLIFSFPRSGKEKEVKKVVEDDTDKDFRI
ncbi:MAG: DUF378 domain-containing protein [Patescibacteria group bacterium]|jgi:uncharacterized membrane protein YuzA (DUF378 family)|nr:DUF378 domain-containing protein [Patescibacteria group bacterium]